MGQSCTQCTHTHHLFSIGLVFNCHFSQNKRLKMQYHHQCRCGERLEQCWSRAPRNTSDSADHKRWPIRTFSWTVTESEMNSNTWLPGRVMDLGASLRHPSLIKHFHKEHPVWGIWSHPQSWVSQNTGWPQRLKLTSSTGNKEEGPSRPLNPVC